jgi:hypothetical protein
MEPGDLIITLPMRWHDTARMSRRSPRSGSGAKRSGDAPGLGHPLRIVY